MDEIEEPVIVAYYRDRHHAKRDQRITQIVPADKLSGTGIGNRGHLIFMT